MVLKDTPCGIEIPLGTNNKSADMDVDDVTIIGTGESGSVGIRIFGYDNTITNVRIYNMETGVLSDAGGNAFRDVRIYNTLDNFYSNTKGFEETGHQNNFYYHCYVQDYEIAYKLLGSTNIVDSCTAKWTRAIGSQTMFKMKTGTNVSACRAEFFGNVTQSFGTANFDFKIEKK